MTPDALDRSFHHALLLQLFGKQIQMNSMWYSPPDGSPGYEVPEVTDTHSPLARVVQTVINDRATSIADRAGQMWAQNLDAAFAAVDEMAQELIRKRVEELFREKLDTWNRTEQVKLREVIEAVAADVVRERLEAREDLAGVVDRAVAGIDLSGVRIEVKLPSREVEAT